MYICTECSEKYKKKPKYCSCGNDEFSFVAESEIVENYELPPVQQYVPEEINNKNVIPVNLILSIGIFVICLILSILVWFINPKPVLEKNPQKQVEVAKDIPNIDEIWNDTSPEQISKPIQVSKPVQLVQKPIEKVQEQIKKIIEPPKNVKVNNASNEQLNKSKQNKNKKVEVEKSKPVTIPQEKPKQVVTEKPKEIKLPQSIVNAIKAPVPDQNVEKQVEQVQPTIPEPPKMSEAEFLNYKGAIRSALLAKLNVVAVQGVGDCAVEFSLDSSGKLINRNFIYKSANKTVNDEVYNMLMRLPYYKQPPAHYNGEKIKLKFMFNNGYYEITFI